MLRNAVLKQWALKPFGGHRQKGNALLYATVIAAGMLSTLAVVRMKTSNLLQVSYQTRSKAVAAHANETAAKIFSQLLEYEKIVICGHNMEIGVRCNAAGTVCAPGQSTLVCGPGDEGEFKVKGLQPGVPTPGVWGHQWEFQGREGQGGGTFIFRQCDPRTLNQLDTMFGDSGFQPHLSSCEKLETTLVADVSATGTYIISDVSTPIDINTAGTATTTEMSFSFRMVMPNGCTDKVRDDDYDESRQYSMTNVKKIITVKNAREFAKMRDGGRYKLENDINLSDWDDDGIDDHVDPSNSADVLQPPYHRTVYKNIVVQGNGKKIKMKNVDRRDEEAIGAIAGAECSLIDDVIVDIGDDDDDSVPDDHGLKGKKCTGGIVGILRRGLVANSSVSTKKSNSFATIWAEEGLGALVGCLGEGFWNSKVTAAFAEAVLKVMDGNPDDGVEHELCVGGAVGRADSGSVTDVYTAGQIVAILENILLGSGFGGVVGCAGNHHDPNLDDNTPLIVRAQSEVSQYPCNDAFQADPAGLCIDKNGVDRNGTAQGTIAVGGIIGKLKAGRVDKSFMLSEETSSVATTVNYGNTFRSGGYPGLIGTTNEIIGGEKVAGLIGEIELDERGNSVAINEDINPKGQYATGATSTGIVRISGSAFKGVKVKGEKTVGGIVGQVTRHSSATAPPDADFELALVDVDVSKDKAQRPVLEVTDPSSNLGGIIGSVYGSLNPAEETVQVKAVISRGELRQNGALCDSSSGGDCDMIIQDAPGNVETELAVAEAYSSLVGTGTTGATELTTAEVDSGACPIGPDPACDNSGDPHSIDSYNTAESEHRDAGNPIEIEPACASDRPDVDCQATVQATDSSETGHAGAP